MTHYTVKRAVRRTRTLNKLIICLNLSYLPPAHLHPCPRAAPKIEHGPPCEGGWRATCGVGDHGHDLEIGIRNFEIEQLLPPGPTRFDQVVLLLDLLEFVRRSADIALALCMQLVHGQACGQTKGALSSQNWKLVCCSNILALALSFSAHAC